MSKGSNPRPYSVPLSNFDKQYDKIFGKKTEVKAGKYKFDPEAGKFIPYHEWFAKYGEPVKQTHYIIGDIEPYVSPVTGEVVASRRTHKEDLKRSGCRVYEGREQEQKEADRHLAYEDKKLEKQIEESVEKTYYGLRDKTVESAGEKISWTFGE